MPIRLRREFVIIALFLGACKEGEAGDPFAIAAGPDMKPKPPAEDMTPPPPPNFVKFGAPDCMTGWTTNIPKDESGTLEFSFKSAPDCTTADATTPVHFSCTVPISPIQFPAKYNTAVLTFKTKYDMQFHTDPEVTGLAPVWLIPSKGSIETSDSDLIYQISGLINSKNPYSVAIDLDKSSTDASGNLTMNFIVDTYCYNPDKKTLNAPAILNLSWQIQKAIITFEK